MSARQCRVLTEQSALGRSLEDFDRALLATIEEHPKDVPFALIFHVEANGVNSEFCADLSLTFQASRASLEAVRAHSSAGLLHRTCA